MKRMPAAIRQLKAALLRGVSRLDGARASGV